MKIPTLGKQIGLNVMRFVFFLSYLFPHSWALHLLHNVFTITFTSRVGMVLSRWGLRYAEGWNTKHLDKWVHRHLYVPYYDES